MDWSCDMFPERRTLRPTSYPSSRPHKLHTPRVFEEKLCRPTITATDRVEGGTLPSSGGN
jgi:hypothetical protein